MTRRPLSTLLVLWLGGNLVQGYVVRGAPSFDELTNTPDIVSIKVPANPGATTPVPDDANKAPNSDLEKRIAVLKENMKLHNFEEIDSQIQAIRKVAPDFNSRPYLDLVNGFKLDSKRRLDKARRLAMRGDLEDAMSEFEAAAEEWPGNPDLQNVASHTFGAEDKRSLSTPPNDDGSAVQGDVAAPPMPSSNAQTEDAIPIKSLITQSQDRVQLSHEIEPVPSADLLEGAAGILREELRRGMVGEDRERLGWDFEGVGARGEDGSAKKAPSGS
jgi:hypothetical protein